MISEIDLQEWKRLTDGATPGPWTTEDAGWAWGVNSDFQAFCRMDEGQTMFPAPGLGACMDDCPGHEIQYPPLETLEGPKKFYPFGEDEGPYLGANDARFIAMARTAMPLLIEEVQRWQAIGRKALEYLIEMEEAKEEQLHTIMEKVGAEFLAMTRSDGR